LVCYFNFEEQTIMKTLASLTLACAALAALSGCGTTAPAVDTSTATVRNGILVGPSGMTLYTLDRDVANSGKSVCNGACATNWPPLMAKANAVPIGAYTVVTRDDGMKQWAAKGKPLYYWVKDTKPGDTTGDGVQGVWHTAKP
jgi:predicted lipoprotein with Yx(FWY)xxD motif